MFTSPSLPKSAPSRNIWVLDRLDGLVAKVLGEEELLPEYSLPQFINHSNERLFGGRKICSLLTEEGVLLPGRGRAAHGLDIHGWMLASGCGKEAENSQED
ncbi:hypothetical protein TcWFU_004643 [Taenia crassiceps]|uniref:Uncharacterized protein n=1 Tax=Taenia crassiceps TaxID=6207 RepID=A0ABR4Q2B0_9CEST